MFLIVQKVERGQTTWDRDFSFKNYLKCEEMKPHKSVICVSSRFDSNFIRFHKSYFPYEGVGQNGIAIARAMEKKTTNLSYITL